jgi:SET domain-containing protein
MHVNVEVKKSAIAGKGLYAARPIQKGALIMRMTGKRVKDTEVDKLIANKKIKRDNPLQVGARTYYILDNVAIAANHSCEPNAAVLKVNMLVALKTIKQGEEITFDYACTVGRENEGWVMRCRCNTKACRSTIGAWTTLPRKVFAQVLRKGALPRFILDEVRQYVPK